MTSGTSGTSGPSVTTTTGRTTQAEAVQVALTGSSLARGRVAARALLGLLRAPQDTENAFLLGIAANAAAFPAFLMRFISSAEGDRLLQQRPAIDRHEVDYAALRALPAGTLGGAYARFLDDNGLDPDLFQAPPGLPRIVSYIAQRIRQTHDLWHVLTGYGTGVHDELALQAFTYGQTGMPSGALIAIGGSLRWGLRAPGVLRKVLGGYRRGKAAAFLPVVRWEDRWQQPLAEVRAALGITDPPTA